MMEECCFFHYSQQSTFSNVFQCVCDILRFRDIRAAPNLYCMCKWQCISSSSLEFKKKKGLAYPEHLFGIECLWRYQLKKKKRRIHLKVSAHTRTKPNFEIQLKPEKSHQCVHLQRPLVTVQAILSRVLHCCQ